MASATAAAGARASALLLGVALVCVGLAATRTGGFLPPEVTVLPFVLVALAATLSATRRGSLDPADQRAVLGVTTFAAVWTAVGIRDGFAWEEFALGGAAIAWAASYAFMRLVPMRLQGAAVLGLVTIAALTAADAIVGFVIGRPRYTLVFDGAARLSGSFAYPNALGHFAAFGIVLCAASQRPRAWLVRITLMLSVLVLVWSGSRGSILVAVVGLAALGRRDVYRHFLRPWTLAAVALGTLLLASTSTVARVFDNASVQDRAAEWAAAWRAGMSNPISGVGPEQPLLIENFRGTAVADFAHNELLQVFAGAGLVGAAALGFAAWSVGFACRRRRDADLARASCFALLAAGTIDFSWHFVAITAFAGMTAGVEAAPARSEELPSTARRRPLPLARSRRTRPPG